MTLLHICDALINSVFPAFCKYCRILLPGENDVMCEYCWHTLPQVSPDHDIFAELKSKLGDKMALVGIISTWKFQGKVQHLIYRLKYYHKPGIARNIASWMLKRVELDFQIDCIIPVPLHKKRLRDRGYNQSALLAKEIARVRNIPYDETSLLRIKNTRSQTRLNFADRMKNVADAFIVSNHDKIRGKKILLIDDVITTGSTVNACARQLISNGAAAVYALSAAKA